MQTRDQWHVHLQLLGLALEHLDSVDAFRDLAQPGNRLVKAEASTERKAHLEIAAFLRCAGDDQVANPCQPEKGHGIGTQLHGETSHFRKSAGDKHATGVLTRSEEHPSELKS